jgi:hypothetical protein
MTNQLYLMKLIDKKASWQYAMPIFREDELTLVLTKGTTYYGALRFLTETNVFFECYIESLKGIVELITDRLAMKDPLLQFKVDTKKLRENYPYQERLSFYYPGGKTSIDMIILVEDGELLEEEKQDKQEKQEKQGNQEKFPLVSDLSSIASKSKSLLKQEKRGRDLAVSAHLSKKTYHLDESIEMELTNLTSDSLHLMIEASEEILLPKVMEVFLSDKWSPEWYIKKNMTDRLFGNQVFKHKPFKSVTLNGYLSDSQASLFKKEIILSAKENYD